MPFKGMFLSMDFFSQNANNCINKIVQIVLTVIAKTRIVSIFGSLVLHCP